MTGQQWWEGSRNCGRRGCLGKEIAGMGFCLTHVPDEMLAEAEEVTGLRRMPPTRTARNGVNIMVNDRTAELMTEHGQRLLNAPPLSDPVAALLENAGKIIEWRRIAEERVAQLRASDWRYQNNRLGEQTRAELIILEKALESESRMLIQVNKLGLKERQVAAAAQQVQTLVNAVNRALTVAGIPLERQIEARRELVTALRPTNSTAGRPD